MGRLPHASALTIAGLIALLGSGPALATEIKTSSRAVELPPMIPSNCKADQLLPSVAELNPTPKQRIAYPPRGENETGVYGALTNGQRISRHLKPEVHAGISTLAGALLRNGDLDPALREMIIVRVGYRTGSAYEVIQHGSLAARLGVSQAKLDALACKSPEGLEAPETALIAFVDELLTRNRPTDEALAAVRSHFSDSEVLETVVVTGNWWMLSRMLETAGIPVDERRIGEGGVVEERAK